MFTTNTLSKDLLKSVQSVISEGISPDFADEVQTEVGKLYSDQEINLDIVLDGIKRAQKKGIMNPKMIAKQIVADVKDYMGEGTSNGKEIMKILNSNSPSEVYRLVGTWDPKSPEGKIVNSWVQEFEDKKVSGQDFLKKVKTALKSSGLAESIETLKVIDGNKKSITPTPFSIKMAIVQTGKVSTTDGSVQLSCDSETNESNLEVDGETTWNGYNSRGLDVGIIHFIKAFRKVANENVSEGVADPISSNAKLFKSIHTFNRRDAEEIQGVDKSSDQEPKRPVGKGGQVLQDGDGVDKVDFTNKAITKSRLGQASAPKAGIASSDKQVSLKDTTSAGKPGAQAPVANGSTKSGGETFKKVKNTAPDGTLNAKSPKAGATSSDPMPKLKESAFDNKLEDFKNAVEDAGIEKDEIEYVKSGSKIFIAFGYPVEFEFTFQEFTQAKKLFPKAKWADVSGKNESKNPVADAALKVLRESSRELDDTLGSFYDLSNTEMKKFLEDVKSAFHNGHVRDISAMDGDKISKGLDAAIKAFP